MIDKGESGAYGNGAESTAPSWGRRMTTAMNDAKKQWTKPGIQRLEGAEAEKALELIYSIHGKPAKDLRDTDLKRRTG